MNNVEINRSSPPLASGHQKGKKEGPGQRKRITHRCPHTHYRIHSCRRRGQHPWPLCQWWREKQMDHHQAEAREEKTRQTRQCPSSHSGAFGCLGARLGTDECHGTKQTCS
jgi:hypothetical protein